MKTLTVTVSENGQQIAQFEIASESNVADIWKAIEPLRTDKAVPVPIKVGRKYSRLAQAFAQLTDTDTQLSFAQIEDWLGERLPASAREHRAWWANDPSHAQARAWMASGWRSQDVDLASETLRFRRHQE